MSADAPHIHDCPVLGRDAGFPRALVSDASSKVVLYYQYKCPMCGFVAAEREWADGITPRPDGTFLVDPVLAERLMRAGDA